jgi:hypothetical protein
LQIEKIAEQWKLGSFLLFRIEDEKLELGRHLRLLENLKGELNDRRNFERN